MKQMKTADKTSLEIKRFINAPRERVYRAWTDPAELQRWFGPEDVRTIKIAADVRIVVASPEFAERTKPFGVDPQASTPQELDTFLRAEIAKWGEIAAKANLKVD